MNRHEGQLTIGEVIRRQRELAALPMRQLAAMVGISNPYLSQIEHGQRAPSQEVLESIAESLRVSVDSLRSEPGSTGPRVLPAVNAAMVSAIRADGDLTVAQRRALVEVYLAMVEATASRRKRRGQGRSEDDDRKKA